MKKPQQQHFFFSHQIAPGHQIFEHICSSPNPKNMSCLMFKPQKIARLKTTRPANSSQSKMASHWASIFKRKITTVHPFLKTITMEGMNAVQLDHWSMLFISNIWALTKCTQFNILIMRTSGQDFFINCFSRYFKSSRNFNSRWCRKSEDILSFRCWWFQIFFIFIPTWGNDPILLIFFKWVETTNQL